MLTLTGEQYRLFEIISLFQKYISKIKCSGFWFELYAEIRLRLIVGSMKIFNLKLSIGVTVAFIGLGTVSMMNNPKNNYPEYHKPSVSTDISAITNSGCSNDACSINPIPRVNVKDINEIFTTNTDSDLLTNKTPSKVVDGATVAKTNNNSNHDMVTPKITTEKPLKDILKSVTVKSNDSVISVCRRININADDVSDMIYGGGISESKFDLVIGQRVDARVDSDGNLLELMIHNKNGLTYKSFERNGNKYLFKNKNYPHSELELSKKFLLGSDFLKQAKSAGLNDLESKQLLDKLNDRVDFKKLGADTVVAVDITETIINEKVNSFIINAVKISSEKYNLSAFNYDNNLYDENGESLSPSFLKNPLLGKVRVTSHFSLNRMHPILHYRRPHWGTDYGCPIGTPIVAISDSVVIRSGRVRGFGNMVMLKHPHHIETIAAHMLRIADGIKVGNHVKKGEVVGYVGKTGLSTGPHLHFEMRINGKRVDSLKAKLPTSLNVMHEKRFQLIEAMYKEKMDNI